MWWNTKRKSGTTRRDKLIDARKKLQQQIDILKMENPAYYRDNAPQNSKLIADMKNMLSQIDSEIENGKDE